MCRIVAVVTVAIALSGCSGLKLQGQHADPQTRIQAIAVRFESHRRRRYSSPFAAVDRRRNPTTMFRTQNYREQG